MLSEELLAYPADIICLQVRRIIGVVFIIFILVSPSRGSDGVSVLGLGEKYGGLIRFLA
jgi:hypothetical protein